MSQTLVAVAHDQRVLIFETKAHTRIYSTYIAPPQSNTTQIEIRNEHINLQEQRKSVGVYAHKYKGGVRGKPEIYTLAKKRNASTVTVLYVTKLHDCTMYQYHEHFNPQQTTVVES